MISFSKIGRYSLGSRIMVRSMLLAKEGREVLCRPAKTPSAGLFDWGLNQRDDGNQGPRARRATATKGARPGTGRLRTIEARAAKHARAGRTGPGTELPVISEKMRDC